MSNALTPIVLLNMQPLRKEASKLGRVMRNKPVRPSQIKALDVGDAVIVFFECRQSLEVEIEARRGKKQFIGKVVDPDRDGIVALGTRIHFHACNVAAVL